MLLTDSDSKRGFLALLKEYMCDFVSQENESQHHAGALTKVALRKGE